MRSAWSATKAAEKIASTLADIEQLKIIMTVPEYLDEAARLTRQWSDEMCVVHGDSQWSCRPYHRAWSTLRLIGAISGVRTDSEFLLEKYRLVARTRPAAKVLIAGAADHSILHLVVSAFRSEGADPDISMMDMCPTTLALNQWYAKRVGARLQTYQGDIRRVAEMVDAQDLITTHSVFSFLSPQEIAGFAASLKRTLRHGGQFVFGQGISPDRSTGSRITFSAEEALRFEALASRRFSECESAGDLDETSVRALARGFAASKNIFAIGNSQVILEPLAEAGFVQEYVQEVVRLPHHYQSSAPTPEERSFSLRVVATAS